MSGARRFRVPARSGRHGVVRLTDIPPGRIVILNGAPRSGKSSIATVIQERFDGPWMNLGVDAYVHHITPPRYRPGIGLRPGGERPDLEPFVAACYAALYESVAARSRLGLHLVVDVGHHNAYAESRHTLADAARRLVGLPALLVGVRCPIDGSLSVAARTKAVENHYKWVDAANFLGCFAIRVNAASAGKLRRADGEGRRRSQARRGVRSIEWHSGHRGNHGGLSSNGQSLAGVMKKVNLPNCGTLPDFGNFDIGGGQQYDRYKGVAELAFRQSREREVPRLRRCRQRDPHRLPANDEDREGRRVQKLRRNRIRRGQARRSGWCASHEGTPRKGPSGAGLKAPVPESPPAATPAEPKDTGVGPIPRHLRGPGARGGAAHGRAALRRRPVRRRNARRRDGRDRPRDPDCELASGAAGRPRRSLTALRTD